MKGSIRLGVAYGAPVYLHVSWPIALGFVVFLLATGAAGEAYAESGGATVWLAATVVGFGMVASALLHELAHLFVAARFHFFVERVTLYPFGGVPVLATTVTTRRASFLYGAAGPVSSLLLGIILISLGTYTRVGPSLLWLGLFNLLLGLANLLPAVPLDGPRLWQSLAGKRNSVLYLHLSSYVLGKLLAVALVWMGGGLSLVTRSPNGLLLVLLGTSMLWADQRPQSDQQPFRQPTRQQLPGAIDRRNGHGGTDLPTEMLPEEKTLEREIDGI